MAITFTPRQSPPSPTCQLNYEHHCHTLLACHPNRMLLHLKGGFPSPSSAPNQNKPPLALAPSVPGVPHPLNSGAAPHPHSPAMIPNIADPVILHFLKQSNARQHFLSTLSHHWPPQRLLPMYQQICNMDFCELDGMKAAKTTFLESLHTYKQHSFFSTVQD